MVIINARLIVFINRRLFMTLCHPLMFGRLCRRRSHQSAPWRSFMSCISTAYNLLSSARGWLRGGERNISYKLCLFGFSAIDWRWTPAACSTIAAGTGLTWRLGRHICFMKSSGRCYNSALRKTPQKIAAGTGLTWWLGRQICFINSSGRCHNSALRKVS